MRKDIQDQAGSPRAVTWGCQTAVGSRVRTLAMVLPILGVLVSGCTKFPVPEKDDEGHASFSREVIPALLGRKPYGVDEVEVVADIAGLYGRHTATQMLMRDQAFVEHWSDVLVDLLRVQRQRDGGIAVAQRSDCWGEPTRANPDSSIAAWVRDHEPGDPGAPAPPWNMTDLVQSSVALDNLSPLYRANLFPMSMRRAGSSNGKRAELTSHFLKTYLNRDISCLKCHNPTQSASNKVDGGGNIVWRRTWTIPGHPEKALFGNYYDSTAATSRIEYVMRGDIRKPASGGMGSRPWGMSEACASDFGSRAASGGTPTHTGFQAAGSTNYPSAGFGSLDGAADPKVSLWELEDSLHDGVLKLQDGYERLPGGAPVLPPDEQLYCDVVQDVSANCTGCHSGGSPSGGMNLAASDLGTELVNAPTESGNSTNSFRVVPNEPSSSELLRRVSAASNPPRMPPGGGGMAVAATFEAWINAGAATIDSASCTTSSIPDVDADEAFAFLTASNLVDGIWMAIMGYRLTIDNGFPRNRDQRDALRNLTEYTFLPSDWSLQSVLRKIVASNWMGRRAPDISQQSSAYELPMMLDPWVQADPSLVSNPPSHEKANGQGEMVNRFRVNTVLRNIAGSLAWEEPRRFPGGGYPSPLDRELGQYLSPAQPGFSGINFQSLLALENEAGLCSKTGRAVDSDDWVDVLVGEIGTFNAANPNAPLTIGESWSILKDRLIQDPTIEHHLPSQRVGEPGALTETQAWVALVNEGTGLSLTLNSSATELDTTALTTKIREACGLLVKSPAFLLTNLTPRGYSDNNMPDPPRLAVCKPGEPCGYPAICATWRSKLNAMGKYSACEDRSVRKSTLIIGRLPRDRIFELVNARFRKICHPSICGFVEIPRVSPCLRNPVLCEKFGPIPPIDPEFADFFGKPPVDLHAPGVVVMNANGAVVRKAHDVLYSPAGVMKWRPLESGTTLKTGDQLYVPLYATLVVQHGNRQFGADPLKYKEIEGVSAHLVSISGDDAIAVTDRYFRKKGVLGLAAMIKGEQAGAFESRAVTDRDWNRILGYSARPESMYTPTPEEVAKLNADFRALHQGMEPVRDTEKTANSADD